MDFISTFTVHTYSSTIFDHALLTKSKKMNIIKIRELAERKAKFAQEIGALTTELEQNKQIAEAAVQRANAAEELQRSMAVLKIQFSCPYLPILSDFPSPACSSPFSSYFVVVVVIIIVVF